MTVRRTSTTTQTQILLTEHAATLRGKAATELIQYEIMVRRTLKLSSKFKVESLNSDALIERELKQVLKIGEAVQKSLADLKNIVPVVCAAFAASNISTKSGIHIVAILNSIEKSNELLVAAENQLAEFKRVGNDYDRQKVSLEEFSKIIEAVAVELKNILAELRPLLFG